MDSNILAKITDGSIADDLGVLTIDNNTRLDKRAISAVTQLQNKARIQGIDLQIASGYRSIARQLDIWNGKATGRLPLLGEHGEQLDVRTMTQLEVVHRICRWSAIPGASRHHWGTDFDIYDANCMEDGYQLQLTIEETKSRFIKLYGWLDVELPNNDFYRPYFNHVSINSSSTDSHFTCGIGLEPWHLSYKPIAQAYQEQFNQQWLFDVIERIDIEFKQHILNNMDILFNQYCTISYE